MACNWFGVGRARKAAKDDANDPHGGGSVTSSGPETTEPGPWPTPILPPPSVPIRVTQDSDGPFAPRMMSDRANAWVDGNRAFVFAGSRETGGPRFFEVDLATGLSTARDDIALPYRGETEFWYWMPDGALMVASGPRLHRLNVFALTDDVVLDISATLPGHTLDQWHSSDDGTTHSATVKNESYRKVGTVVVRHGQQFYFGAEGVLDESQPSRNGRHLLIKENRGSGDDNKVVDLESGEIQWLRDQVRAVQHSDCGPDYVIGEADKPDPGGCVVWYLDRLHEGPRFLFPSLNLGYMSARGGKHLWSNDTHLSLVGLDGSVTSLIEHGADVRPNEPGYYDRRPKASMDASASVATFMRPDGSVYLLVLP